MYKLILSAAVLFFATPGRAAAQEYLPLGPLSNVYCILFPDGTTQLGRIGKDGIGLAAFGPAADSYRKSLKGITRKLKDAREARARAAQESKFKFDRVIRSLKDQRDILKSELDALVACESGVPVPAGVIKPEIFSFEYDYPSGRRVYVFAAAVFESPVEIYAGNKVVKVTANSSWCLQTEGDDVSAETLPPYEGVKFATDDPCLKHPSVNKACASLLGKKRFAIILYGIPEGDAEDRVKNEEAAAAYVARHQFTARPQVGAPCNNRFNRD